jgi:hypothetical protein
MGTNKKDPDAIVLLGSSPTDRHGAWTRKWNDCRRYGIGYAENKSEQSRCDVWLTGGTTWNIDTAFCFLSSINKAKLPQAPVVNHGGIPSKDEVHLHIVTASPASQVNSISKTV